MPSLNFDQDAGKRTLTVWDKVSEEEEKEIFSFSQDYKSFLNQGKTEREVVEFIVSQAKVNGFCDLGEKTTLAPGDRVFYINRDKAIVLAVIGRDSLEKGIGFIGAHIDSPRLDLKPEPVYEDGFLALFKTHYYGGIKKYHWVGIPLALHGVVVRQDGSRVRVAIGEDPQDPVFTITDLLPHLAKDQMEKKMSEGITGEALNPLVGEIPEKNSESGQRIKDAVVNYLQEHYRISQEDLVSAELQMVPAWPARDIGFDRGQVAAYGQDDRVCSYTAFRALLELGVPDKTSILLLADKEETGSAGNTGMQSFFLEDFVAELIERREKKGYNDLLLRRCFMASSALSADVNAAVDPNYPEVMDKHNAARLGRGVVLTRYTGSRGKSGSNEASAEFTGKIRGIFNSAGVYWQTGELGKVDQGGGGTIAYLLAAHNMEVVDCGVPLLGMHSTFEVASKADIYMTYKAYKAFWEKI